jgi:hypothetical protein
MILDFVRAERTGPPGGRSIVHYASTPLSMTNHFLTAPKYE